MAEDKSKTSKPASKSAAEKPAPRLSREEQIALYVRARPKGRRGAARRRAVPSVDATKLSITAHDRCRRRGIKLMGLHFTCGEAIELTISKLPRGIAAKLCTHPELIAIEFDKEGKRLTPEIKRPKPPERKLTGSQLLNPKGKPVPSPAGTLATKRRRASGELPAPKEPTKGKSGATNHPKPAELAPKKSDDKKPAKSRRDG